MVKQALDDLYKLNNKNGIIKIVHKLYGNQVFLCGIDTVSNEEKLHIRIADYDISLLIEEINEIRVTKNSTVVKSELMEITIIHE